MSIAVLDRLIPQMPPRRRPRAPWWSPSLASSMQEYSKHAAVHNVSNLNRL